MVLLSAAPRPVGVASQALSSTGWLAMTPMEGEAGRKWSRYRRMTERSCCFSGSSSPSTMRNSSCWALDVASRGLQCFTMHPDSHKTRESDSTLIDSNRNNDVLRSHVPTAQ
ncbi:hypothetical protein EYF80_060470 [Liparis tanakae]|uniref:Uncharacterized protein n=1 Tax=Liparis tanakae TaxID=230148 RepID=A0A4Z2ELE4_9TELE|nr:hypothetical protein EYF80_060470 [Liparis tanakae]